MRVPAVLPPEQCVGHLEAAAALSEAQVLAALGDHEHRVEPVLRYYRERMKVGCCMRGGVEM